MRQGPAWLGIGAQRSGTTWFTDLLLQHPQMRLSSRGLKELHRLYRGLYTPINTERYLRLFDVPEGLPGEFTPFYLRALWAPAAARQVCDDNVPLIVLLRDPIDRFESAMRLSTQARQAMLRRYKATPAAERKDPKRPPNRIMRWQATDAQWSGMYATQLDVWASVFPRRQFIVLQYEALKKSPAETVEIVWRRLGLSPVPLTDIDTPSRTRTEGLVDWQWPEGFREALHAAYKPEVDRLQDWGIDTALWRNF